MTTLKRCSMKQNLTDVTGDHIITKARLFVEDDGVTVHREYTEDADLHHDAAAGVAYEQAMNQLLIQLKDDPEHGHMVQDICKKICSMASIVMRRSLGYDCTNPFPEMEADDEPEADTRH